MKIEIAARDINARLAVKDYKGAHLIYRQFAAMSQCVTDHEKLRKLLIV